MIDSKPTINDILSSDNPFRFSKNFEGGCACCDIEGIGFSINVHCWRACCSCEFSGIHISGEISDKDKSRLGQHIRDNNPWTDSTDWEIVVG